MYINQSVHIINIFRLFKKYKCSMTPQVRTLKRSNAPPPKKKTPLVSPLPSVSIDFYSIFRDWYNDFFFQFTFCWFWIFLSWHLIMRGRIKKYPIYTSRIKIYKIYIWKNPEWRREIKIDRYICLHIYIYIDR